ncbi:MAG: hypothetical protein K5921_00560 [Lachnospiraceae bacterium]|nr:hypothetical protein [Lachnospiraceae bacterium]
MLKLKNGLKKGFKKPKIKEKSKVQYDDQKIIEGFKKANNDMKDMVIYLKDIDDPSQLKPEDFPSSVRECQDPNSKSSNIYKDMLVSAGADAVFDVFTYTMSGALTTIGESAIGAGVLPMIGVMAIPVALCAAVPLSSKLIKSIKVKKYVKANKAEMKKNRTELESQKSKLEQWFEDLRKKAASLDAEMEENRKRLFEEFKTKAKKMADDIAIKIDDCMNVDTNKRIQEYQEVILKQYQMQKMLEDKVDYLFVDYEELREKKKELDREVDCLIRILNTLQVPEYVINHALSEDV